MTHRYDHEISYKFTGNAALLYDSRKEEKKTLLHHLMFVPFILFVFAYTVHSWRSVVFPLIVASPFSVLRTVLYVYYNTSTLCVCVCDVQSLFITVNLSYMLVCSKCVIK